MAIVEKDGIKFLDGLSSDYIVIESSCLENIYATLIIIKLKLCICVACILI